MNRRTTIEVDPAAVGRGVLAFVMVRASAWMGVASTEAVVVLETFFERPTDPTEQAGRRAEQATAAQRAR